MHRRLWKISCIPYTLPYICSFHLVENIKHLFHYSVDIALCFASLNKSTRNFVSSRESKKIPSSPKAEDILLLLLYAEKTFPCDVYKIIAPLCGTSSTIYSYSDSVIQQKRHLAPEYQSQVFHPHSNSNAEHVYDDSDHTAGHL